MKKKIFFKFTLVFLLISSPSYAYFDPGSGAFIIQAIIALFAAITFYLGYPIRVLKKIIIKIKKIFFKIDDNDKKKD
tara:strand:+ start:4122 stop:4352 length:231 start_codon:yes stop_codon:yes gene_type:complete